MNPEDSNQSELITDESVAKKKPLIEMIDQTTPLIEEIDPTDERTKVEISKPKICVKDLSNSTAEILGLKAGQIVDHENKIIIETKKTEKSNISKSTKSIPIQEIQVSETNSKKSLRENTQPITTVDATNFDCYDNEESPIRTKEGNARLDSILNKHKPKRIEAIRPRIDPMERFNIDCDDDSDSDQNDNDQQKGDQKDTATKNDAKSNGKGDSDKDEIIIKDEEDIKTFEQRRKDGK